jgi:hypothetical protein
MKFSIKTSSGLAQFDRLGQQTGLGIGERVRHAQRLAIEQGLRRALSVDEQPPFGRRRRVTGTKSDEALGRSERVVDGVHPGSQTIVLDVAAERLQAAPQRLPVRMRLAVVDVNHDVASALPSASISLASKINCTVCALHHRDIDQRTRQAGAPPRSGNRRRPHWDGNRNFDGSDVIPSRAG